MTTSLQCILCKHYWGVGKCSAYPDNIPDEIITGEFDHTKEYKGDNGIRFEPIEKKKDVSD